MRLGAKSPTLQSSLFNYADINTTLMPCNRPNYEQKLFVIHKLQICSQIQYATLPTLTISCCSYSITSFYHDRKYHFQKANHAGNLLSQLSSHLLWKERKTGDKQMSSYINDYSPSLFSWMVPSLVLNHRDLKKVFKATILLLQFCLLFSVFIRL